MSDVFISQGDYVIVQEGQVDLPKIVALQDVTIAEAISIAFPTGAAILLSLFEDVIAQDSITIVKSVALEASDSVRVQEGQSDGPIPVILEGVSLTEFVDIGMTRLNIAVNDILTITDAIVITIAGIILPQINVSESVIVQEDRTVRVTVYINVFDELVGLDGSRNMDVNDAVTVADVVDIRIHPLKPVVNDTLTVTESVQVGGPGHAISIFDEFVIADAVTVLLRQVTPEANDAVVVADQPTVSVSSLSLLMDLNEVIAVADVIDNIYTLPIQITEFTEVITVEVIAILTSVVRIDQSDSILVNEDVTMLMRPILLDVNESVTLVERIAVKPGAGVARKKDLPTVKVGR